MSMSSISGYATGQFQQFPIADGRRERRQAWLPEAERLFAEGRTYVQIAATLGKSYGTIASVFGGRARNKTPRAWHVEAMALLREGATLADAAKKFGVTRERVRQVATRMRVESKRCRATVSRRNKKIIEMIDHGVSVDEIAAQFAISRQSIYVREQRVRPGEYAKRNRAKRLSELEPALARARAGESYMKAADGDRSLANRIMWVMQNEGVRREVGRWFPKEKRQIRLAYIRAGRRDGDTWKAIAAHISEVEKKLVSATVIYATARKYCPEVFQPRQREVA